MFYLIFGETPVENKILLLNISDYKYIWEIRGAIYVKNKRKKIFVGIEENDLKLWKVDIDDNEIRMLNERLHDINIAQDLNGVELLPREEIPIELNKDSSYFHILVQPQLPPPATT